METVLTSSKEQTQLLLEVLIVVSPYCERPGCDFSTKKGEVAHLYVPISHPSEPSFFAEKSHPGHSFTVPVVLFRTLLKEELGYLFTCQPKSIRM